MKYGSLELVAYKRVGDEETAPELSAWMLTVRNGNRLFGTPVRIPTYELETKNGIYYKMPFAVSDVDDLQLLFTNVEDTEVEVTVYVFFYNTSANPIGTGYATTMKRLWTSMCSVKAQTGL